MSFLKLSLDVLVHCERTCFNMASCVSGGSPLEKHIFCVCCVCVCERDCMCGV